MKLDRTLIREIKLAVGNGSREAKFALLEKIDAAKKDLSTTDIRGTFNDCLRKHGRAVVAICVAVTLDIRKERIDHWGYMWAQEVMSLLPPSYLGINKTRAYIDDGIHPTMICAYADSFIHLTTEE